ncbi:MAG TPA: hypothetical protein VI260_06220 [Blastocatellia bacterium]|jgi:hypothetical protein
MGMEIFVLQHVHMLDNGEEDVKMIGVYSSLERAEEAIKRLTMKPGFSDSTEGFVVDRYVLNEDCWTEGYITVTGRD